MNKEAKEYFISMGMDYHTTNFLISAFAISNEKDLTSEVIEIIKNSNVIENKTMDLKTACKIEALLDVDIVKIPTKQEWRKIKLDRINDIIKENKNK